MKKSKQQKKKAKEDRGKGNVVVNSLMKDMDSDFNKNELIFGKSKIKFKD